MINVSDPEYQEAAQDKGNLSDSGFIGNLRGQMLKFATAKLRDKNRAEDAVQEALEAALKYSKSFSKRSALKTWVFAILKNKIIDVIRDHNRRAESSLSDQSEDQTDATDYLFNKNGHWQTDQRPRAWFDPEEAVKNDHFMRVFEGCLDKLPPKQARLFMMREFLGQSSKDISAELGLSSSNLHVLMHRARLGLRECLENHWFTRGNKI